MKPTRILVVISSLGPTALLAACAAVAPAPEPADADPILAEVEGEPIRLSDAERFFEGRHEGHLALIAGRPEMSRLVERLIDHRLLVREGYALGMNRDPAIAAAVDRERIRLRRLRLTEHDVDERIDVTEGEVEAFAARSGDRFMISRILVATPEEGAEARAALDAGADFGEIARARSLAPSASRGGAEFPLARESLDAPIDAALDGLEPGEIAGPVAARDGVWVFRLDAMTSETPPPLDDGRRRALREILESRERERLFAAFESRLLAEAGATIDDQAIGRAARDGLPADLDLSSDAAVVARVGDEKLALLDLAQAVEFLPQIEPVASKRLAFLRRRVREWAVDRSLEREARGEKDESEDARALRDLEEALMDAKVRSDFVYDKGPPAEAEVRAYYESHPDEFTLPLTVQLSAIFHEKEEDAVETLRRLYAGEPFDELAIERSEDPSSAARGGEIGVVRPSDTLVELEGPIASLRSGERSGIVRSAKGFHILWVRKRMDSRRLTFEESRAAAAKSLARERRAEALSAWIEKLRSRSTVVVREDGIDRALALVSERAVDAPPPIDPSGHAAQEARQ